MKLQDLIRTVPDFPKPGIMFRDITPLLADPLGLALMVAEFKACFEREAIDYVVGTESRGFLLGAPLAIALGVGFIPVRKPGKLPSATLAQEYSLEYGTDRLEIHQDAFPQKSRIVIIDDLIATGGTAAATAQLVQRLGGEIQGFGFLIELSFLQGRQALPTDIPVHSLITYDQE